MHTGRQTLSRMSVSKYNDAILTAIHLYMYMEHNYMYIVYTCIYRLSAVQSRLDMERRMQQKSSMIQAANRREFWIVPRV